MEHPGAAPVDADQVEHDGRIGERSFGKLEGSQRDMGAIRVEAVNVLEYPLDTGSDRRLAGDTSRSDLQAKFKLHVVIGDEVDESS